MISIFILITLLSTRQCSNTCKIIDRYCYCDDKCGFYGDCCPSNANYNINGLFNDMLTCKRMFSSEKVLIIDRCPNKNHRYAGSCSQIQTLDNMSQLKSFVPVITDDGVTYNNAFCAKCNNKIRYKYHNVTVKCRGIQPKNEDEQIKFYNNLDRCKVRSISTEHFRLCHDKLIRECPKHYNGTRSISDSCQNGKFEEFRSGKLFYRNIDCCRCWNVMCQQPRNFLVFHESMRNDEFTYLLNFNQWNEPIPTEIKLENSNMSYNETSGTTGSIVIFYASFILTLLSIVSVVFIIGIYLYNVQFHNFGGYLTICLSTCLLFMNVVTLLLANVPILPTNFCRIISIIQHFIALSNFIWMAIYALDLVQTFGLETTHIHKRKTFNTFLVYCAIGFGISTLVVGTATIAEYSLGVNSTIRPKYGGRKCWFTSKFGGIIWYFAPVSLLILCNLVACVAVFYKLLKTAKECRIIRGNESNKTLWLCVRLTAVFGIGYLLQILAVLSDINGLVVAGSMVNCTQGCLLAACFLWTKKVRNILKSCKSSMKPSTENMSNSNRKTQSTELLSLSNNAYSHQ